MSSAKLLAGYADDAMVIFNIIKWPISLLIIYLNIKLIYTIAPSKNIRSEETTYGAMFTTFGWIIATLVFKFYLNHFARYDIIYGNLAAIIIMMVWMYFLSYIFVLGMAINVSRKEEQELVEEQNRLEEERLAKERLKQEKKEQKKTTKKVKKESKSNQ
jgi:YihY family inner membrane protein